MDGGREGWLRVKNRHVCSTCLRKQVTKAIYLNSTQHMRQTSLPSPRGWAYPGAQKHPLLSTRVQCTRRPVHSLLLGGGDSTACVLGV
ncbi:hypothetical protein GJAV_G00122330 [Gymnothorax javanicus]|nr:hypothetical protein GJAV_G00122330 [Gymnothorax javanicus]